MIGTFFYIYKFICHENKGRAVVDRVTDDIDIRRHVTHDTLARFAGIAPVEEWEGGRGEAHRPTSFKP
jgi:hypothetical protein